MKWTVSLTIEDVEHDRGSVEVGGCAGIEAGVAQGGRRDEQVAECGWSLFNDHGHAPSAAVVADDLNTNNTRLFFPIMQLHTKCIFLVVNNDFIQYLFYI